MEPDKPCVQSHACRTLRPLTAAATSAAGRRWNDAAMAAPRAILHVDMDAFYAAVEQRDRPELRGQPVIVGADPQGGRGRGVVATASYEARRFGVAARCPSPRPGGSARTASTCRPDMEKYARGLRRGDGDPAALHRLRGARLDRRGVPRRHGAAGAPLGDGETRSRAQLKDAIRARDRRSPPRSASPPSKLVAKVASDMRKPDGLVVVPPGGEAAFLAPLPVRRLWGVGPKMEESLARLGVHTIGDAGARAIPRGSSGGSARTATTSCCSRAAIDDRPVVAEREEAKSIGQEHTFDADTADLARLRRTLLELADACRAPAARAHGLRGGRSRSSTATRLPHPDPGADRSPTPPTPATRSSRWPGACSRASTAAARCGCWGSTSPGSVAAQLGAVQRAAPSPSDRVRDAVDERFGDDALTRASLLVGRGPGVNPELMHPLAPAYSARWGQPCGEGAAPEYPARNGERGRGEGVAANPAFP